MAVNWHWKVVEGKWLCALSLPLIENIIEYTDLVRPCLLLWYSHIMSPAPIYIVYCAHSSSSAPHLCCGWMWVERKIVDPAVVQVLQTPIYIHKAPSFAFMLLSFKILSYLGSGISGYRYPWSWGLAYDGGSQISRHWLSRGFLSIGTVVKNREIC